MHLAAASQDGQAHVLDDAGQPVGADVRMCVGQNVLLGPMLHEDAQDAVGISALLTACEELAVAVGASSALAKGVVALGIHALFHTYARHILLPFPHVLASLDDHWVQSQFDEAQRRKFSDKRILHALACAGLVGNVAKSLASISGAEAGCQAEVGVACAMAAAAANYIFGGSLATIEYAAEMGLEHHLGMTCDPICGLVQIPCIERNAHAAARALDANIYATYAEGIHRISYDKAVEVMKQTGHDLPSLYRETSEGGLAKEYMKNSNESSTERIVSKVYDSR